ncbi:conserved hypothetical protein TPPCIT_031 [Candidatus Tremblaya princeps PCIT]|uniref:DUF2059 domain-containing protein n=1 Tax=Tremblaya princeps (strain PCIT) TaxID=891398 RepID=F7XYC7_TREPP|nr:conserved hypothetical protein TPPCIT_031 [Candidatus Tremblaya princeps PCIT]
MSRLWNCNCRSRALSYNQYKEVNDTMLVLIFLAACLREMSGPPAHRATERVLALCAWLLLQRKHIRQVLPLESLPPVARCRGSKANSKAGLACCAVDAGGDWFATLISRDLPAYARKDGPIPPRKLEAIGELMVAECVPAMISNLVKDVYRRTEQLIPIVEGNILANRNLTPSQRARVVMWMRRCVDSDVHKAAYAPFAGRGFWNAVIHEMCMAYSRYYTTTELRDITEFYSSTAGAKYMKHRRQVGRDVFDRLVKRCTLEHMRSLYRRIRAEAIDMLGIIG